MPSQVDFAVAVGLFFTFIAILLLYLVNYMTSYTGLTSTSELRTVAYDIYSVLFGGKGIPSNWHETYMPLKVGLITDLYRVPVVITETNGTDRGTVVLNVSMTFDSACESKAWNNTVRLHDSSNEEVPMQLYNQTFCSSQYLRNADMVFNSSFSPNQQKTFLLYYSPDKNITGSNYTLNFPNVTNFTFVIYPEEQLSALSVSKLKALRNLSYDEVVKTLGTEYYFNLEISE